MIKNKLCLLGQKENQGVVGVMVPPRPELGREKVKSDDLFQTIPTFQSNHKPIGDE